ncbi:MAG: HPr family phosphocarrier protein [Pyrinomonadaceae bacterium]
MLEKRLKVVNVLGLHARAAAQLVRLAANFKSRILIKRIDTSVTADAKSILSVLSLAASRGTELEASVEGEDQIEALAAIILLFETGFGEM